MSRFVSVLFIALVASSTNADNKLKPHSRKDNSAQRYKSAAARGKPVPDLSNLKDRQASFAARIANAIGVQVVAEKGPTGEEQMDAPTKHRPVMEEEKSAPEAAENNGDRNLKKNDYYYDDDFFKPIGFPGFAPAFAPVNFFPPVLPFTPAPVPPPTSVPPPAPVVPGACQLFTSVEDPFLFQAASFVIPVGGDTNNIGTRYIWETQNIRDQQNLVDDRNLISGSCTRTEPSSADRIGGGFCEFVIYDNQEQDQVTFSGFLQSNSGGNVVVTGGSNTVLIDFIGEIDIFPLQGGDIFDDVQFYNASASFGLIFCANPTAI